MKRPRKSQGPTATPKARRKNRGIWTEELHQIAAQVRSKIAARKLIVRGDRAAAGDQQLQTLIANVSDGLTLSDGSGHFEIFNRRLEEITGYTIDEANRSGDFASLIYPDAHEKEEALSRLRKVIEQGISEEAETTIRAKDGTARTLRVLTVLVPYQDHPMFLTVYRDVTELQSAREELIASLNELRRSEQRLQSEVAEHRIARQALTIFLNAVEETADMVIITDLNGIIEYVNPAFEKISGYRKQEVVGRTPRILKSGKYDKRYYEALWHTITSGGVFRDTLINRRKDGSFYYAEKTVTPIKNEKGEIVRFVSIDKDVTRWKEMERAERLVQLGTLVSDMAHEVNNPLMIISGSAQLALMENPANAVIEQHLKVIVDECGRARDIIQRLLKFSRPSKGEFKKTDINACVEGALSLVEHQLKLMNISIRRSYGTGLPLVSADENQLHEVVINLINNARDAMPQGGTIRIATTTKGSFLHLEVADTGCGMSAENMKRLFEPFFTTKEKGTGLGLSVCYGIIKAHNGELRFQSEPGKGTVVTILLPTQQEET